MSWRLLARQSFPVRAKPKTNGPCSPPPVRRRVVLERPPVGKRCRKPLLRTYGPNDPYILARRGSKIFPNGSCQTFRLRPAATVVDNTTITGGQNTLCFASG